MCFFWFCVEWHGYFPFLKVSRFIKLFFWTLTFLDIYVTVFMGKKVRSLKGSLSHKQVNKDHQIFQKCQNLSKIMSKGHIAPDVSSVEREYYLCTQALNSYFIFLQSVSWDLFILFVQYSKNLGRQIQNNKSFKITWAENKLCMCILSFFCQFPGLKS